MVTAMLTQQRGTHRKMMDVVEQRIQKCCSEPSGHIAVGLRRGRDAGREGLGDEVRSRMEGWFQYAQLEVQKPEDEGCP